MDPRRSYDWKPTASASATLAGVPAAPPPAQGPQAPTDRAALEELTVAEAVDEFIAAAQDGRARNRNGRRYRPSALRDVAGILRGHLVPELGDLRVGDVQWDDLQRLVDQLSAGELSLSRIRSVVSAIRALYAYAIERGIVAASPADGLEIARVEQPLWDDDQYGDDQYGDDQYGDDADGDDPDGGDPYGTPVYSDAAPGAAGSTFLRTHARSLADAAEQAWTEARQGGAERREPRPPSGADRSERGFPETMVSLALRLVVIVFIIIALASLAQSLLLPA
jgi:hypothetical protein